MGVWTCVAGNHTSRKASIKTIVEMVLDGEDIVGTYNHRDFIFRFEHGGIEAAKNIQKIIETFEQFDPKANIELTASIEFFGGK